MKWLRRGRKCALTLSAVLGVVGQEMHIIRTHCKESRQTSKKFKRRQQSSSAKCFLSTWWESRGGRFPSQPQKKLFQTFKEVWIRYTSLQCEVACTTSVGGEPRSAGLSVSLALRLNLWPITHCAEPIRQERTLPLALRGQLTWRLRRRSEWADTFWEAKKKVGWEGNSNAALRSPMCVVCRSVSSAARAQMTERNQTWEPPSSKWPLWS